MKQKNPHEIYEVPKQAGDLDAVGETFGILFPHGSTKRPEVKNDQHAAENVQRVQAGEREINRGEGVVLRAVIFHLLDVGGGDGMLLKLGRLRGGTAQIHEVLPVIRKSSVDGDAAGFFGEIEVLRFLDEMAVGKFAAGQLDFIMNPFVVIL